MSTNGSRRDTSLVDLYATGVGPAPRSATTCFLIDHGTPPNMVLVKRLRCGFYSLLARFDVEVDYAAVESEFFRRTEWGEALLRDG